MSTVYNLEPPPTAKAVVHTTSGEIELELFAKQTPLASRNFLQLCLDGAYDGTIFHRLVPGFIIQGGDPSGTGDGGEAIYDGGSFADEFHSRLKFNRRGLLGMANGGRKDDNGCQFFLTLGTAEELNGKHTMFGRVVGDTIYNLMKMADAELTEEEGSERPMYPTKITKTEVLLNPFEDMVARKAATATAKKTGAPVKKAKKRKGEKALLSFGDEEGDVDVAPVVKKAKFNPTLVDAASEEEKAVPKRPVKRSPPPEELVKPRTSQSSTLPKENSHPERQLPLRDEESPSRSASSSSDEELTGGPSSVLDRTNAQIKELKASMKRDVGSSRDAQAKPKSTLERMVPATAIRGRKRKQNSSKEESRTLQALANFQAKLESAPATSENGADPKTDNAEEGKQTVEEASGMDREVELCDLHFIAGCQSCDSWSRQPEEAKGDVEDGASWMSHALSFAKDRMGKDLTWKKKNEEELVVIDPREKTKNILAEAKAKQASKRQNGRVRDVGRDFGKVK